MSKSIHFDPAGRLVAIDAYGCPFDHLNSAEFLMSEANKAARKAEMNVLAVTVVPFHPQGLSMVLILGESHLTVHTTPERSYAAIDIFTCGKGDPLRAAKHLLKALNPKYTTVKSLPRGLLSAAVKQEDEPFRSEETVCSSAI